MENDNNIEEAEFKEIESDRKKLERALMYLAEMAISAKQVLSDGKFSPSKMDEVLILNEMSNEIIDKFVEKSPEVEKVRNLKLA